MAELPETVETGMPKTVRYGIVAVLVIILFIWLLPRRAGNNSATGPGVKPKPAATVSDRETERRLSAILTGLSPEIVAISSDRLDRVTELAQWASESLTVGDAATVTIDKAANAKWFSGDALKEVNDPSFSLRDGHHLTLANLCGEIVTRLAQKTSDPLLQIDELFRIVIRETMLMPDDHDAKLPGTPFESLLTGRSTAAGRAWALATLLRQLRIDAVVIEPKSKPEAWIIGVITPTGEVLLYDPRLGTNLPRQAASSGFESAGDLASVKQHDELLRAMDLEGFPYPLKAEDLSSVNVKLICDSSSSSLRMAKLQTMITGALMEVFDGLGKSALRDHGLADRVIAAGAKGLWTAADVSVWSYPEQQAEKFMSSGAEQSPAWQGISEIFAGPISLVQERRQTSNESQSATETVVRHSDNPLRRVRVIHLKGRLDEAVRLYLPIQTAASRLKMTPDPELQAKLDEAMPFNAKTADFACFWTAVCQAQTNPRLVPQTLERYGRDFGRGEMIAGVPELWATALLNAGKPKEAIELLESITTNRTPRMAFLLKLWNGAQEPKTDPVLPKPTASPS